MKRTLLHILIAIVVLVCLILALSSCDLLGNFVHIHTYKQNFDENYHWEQCSGCDSAINKKPHSGGVATCQEKATCSICNQKYGDAGSHKYTVKNTSDTYFVNKATCTSGTKYYYSCACGEKGTDTFEINDKLNHGNTEIRNFKAASNYLDGYSGDTYCLYCNKVLSYGAIIPHTSNAPAIVVSNVVTEQNTVRVVFSIANNPGISS